jgi:hypothetical protein
VIRKKLGYPNDPMGFTPIDPRFVWANIMGTYTKIFILGTGLLG